MVVVAYLNVGWLIPPPCYRLPPCAHAPASEERLEVPVRGVTVGHQERVSTLFLEARPFNTAPCARPFCGVSIRDVLPKPPSLPPLDLPSGAVPLGATLSPKLTAAAAAGVATVAVGESS